MREAKDMRDMDELRQMGFRLDGKTVERIKELAEELRLSQAAIVTLAISDLWRSKKMRSSVK